MKIINNVPPDVVKHVRDLPCGAVFRMADVLDHSNVFMRTDCGFVSLKNGGYYGGNAMVTNGERGVVELEASVHINGIK